jgi:diadenosine tetraphosphate (Ap4A) HIT family hydrolase
MDCQFCNLPADRLIADAPLCVTARDRFPVSNGHTLIIPKRHVASAFELTNEEHGAIWAACLEVKTQLHQELAPDGYNIGFNIGEAAGQTVMHVHLHLIPRYCGDMDQPRGGIRHCVAGKGYYEPGE